VPNKKIWLATLSARPRIRLAFLRLPDGNSVGGSGGGEGFEAYGYTSVKQLWEGLIPSITSVDNATTYSKDSLISSLTRLSRTSSHR